MLVIVTMVAHIVKNPTTIIISLICFSSLVHAEEYNQRDDRLLFRSETRFQCESEGFHPDPYDCSIFYRCMDWGEGSENSLQSRFTSFRFQCKDGAIYDIQTNSCIHASKSSRIECRRDQYEPLLINIPRAEALQNSNNNANNQDYGVVQSQGYNPPPSQPSYGNRPSNVGSQIEPASEINNGIQEETPPRVTRSPPCSAEGFFAIENDCSRFYRCVSNGKGFLKYEFSCGEGTVWDPENNACNHAWAVQRKDCRSSTSVNGDPEESNNVDGNENNSYPEQISPGPSSEAPEAEYGSSVVQQSSSTTNPSSNSGNNNNGYWSPNPTASPGNTNNGYGPPNPPTTPGNTNNGYGPSNQPAVPENNNNGNRPPNGSLQNNGNPQQNTSNSNADTSCPSEGFHPVENNCKKFIRCVSNGLGGFTRYEFDCAEGTVWDNDIVTCNYPYAVQDPKCRSDSSSDPSSSNQGSPSDPNQQTSFPEEGVSPSFTPQNSPDGGYPSQSQTTPYGNQQTFSTGQQTSSSFNQQTSSTSSQSSSSSSTSSSFSQQMSSSTSGQQSTFGSSQTSGSTNNYNQQGTGSNQQTTNNQQTSTTGSNQQSSSSNQQSTTNQQQGSISSESQQTTLGGQQGSTTAANQQTSSNGQQSSTTGSNQQTLSSGQQTTLGGQQGSTTAANQQTSSSGQQGSTTGSNKPTTSGTDQQTSSGVPLNQQNQTSPTSGYENTSPGGQAPSNPSSGDVCSAEGFFPSSTNCNKFYRCVSNGGSGYTKYEFNCGPGTVWDPDQNTCNHPWAVQNEKCRSGGSQVTSTGSETTNGTDPNVNTSTVSSSTPASSSSSSSSSPSSNGSSSSVSSSSTTESSLPSSSTIGSSYIPPSSTGSSSTSSTPSPPILSSTPTSPSSNGSSVTPTSSFSNPTLNPYENGTSLSNTTDSPIPSPSTPGSNSSTTPVGSQNSSTSTGSTTSNNSTPMTTLSNETLTNTTATTPGTTPCDNSTKPVKKITCTKAGFYPHPTDCKKFYRCVDWDGDKGERFSVFHFDCPAGTIFDPSLDTCNHEDSVYPPRQCDNNASQVTEPSTSPSTNVTESTSSNATEPTESPTSMPGNSTDPTETTTSAAEGSTGSSTDALTEQITTTAPYQTNSTTSTQGVSTPGVTDVTTEGNTGDAATQTTPGIITSSSEASTDSYTTGATGTPTIKPEENSSPLTTTLNPTTAEEITISSTPVSETCPEVGPDQYALVCPTGFRRHPKYCNLFYQCTVSQTNEIKILTLSCTNGTVYDDKKIQCLPPDQAKKCDGSMMDSRNLRKITDNSEIAPIPVKSDKTICPNKGSFSFNDDCRLFYKCKKDNEGRLNGYIYQCPEGFGYWNVSKRCEKIEKVPCEGGQKTKPITKPTLAPIETKNVGHK